MLRSRMRGAIPPLPQYVFMAWCLVKHSDIFTFTSSVTLREGNVLSAFENRLVGIMFEPKSEELTGGWRKLHNGELHNLYSAPNAISAKKSRKIKWAGHVAHMGEGKGKVVPVLN
jgi:hypothetical protein